VVQDTAPLGKKAHASPSVRKFARELGVDVTRVTGTGPKGRITQLDIQSFVKGVMSGAQAAPAASKAAAGGSGLSVLPWPSLEFRMSPSLMKRILPTSSNSARIPMPLWRSRA
jgi:pyruvate dehydrogenase E2 component (dihydrolipoamide acetyltransferase)